MPYCGSWKDHRKQYDFCCTELEGLHINKGGIDFPESTESNPFEEPDTFSAWMSPVLLRCVKVSRPSPNRSMHV